MRLIKRIVGCVNAILAAAMVSVTLLSGVAASKVNVNAEEITDKPFYYLEDDSTFNKNGDYYIQNEKDVEAFKEYFKWNTYSGAMNVFYEDSTLRIDLEKSLYSIDDIYECSVHAYKLSRDDNGNLEFKSKALILRSDDAFGGGFDGLESNNLFVRWSGGFKNYTKTLNTMKFSEMYNNKNADGRLQVSWSNSGRAEDADIFVIIVKRELSDGSYESTSLVAMPDYMIDKTVLNISKKSDDKNGNDTYTFDITQKDTQIVDNKTFANILKENESKDVVIKSNNNVTFTFEKGTMKRVEGKENYDFSTIINSIYSDTMPSYVTKDNFISQINFNYSGELPARANIHIPVGTQYAGKTLYYSYMNNDNTFADTQTVVVDEEGYITVKQEHCSSYVVTNKAPEYISAGSKDTEQDTQIIESNTENASTDISAPADENVDTPQTSDNNNVCIYVAGIIMALIGVIKFGRVKKAY